MSSDNYYSSLINQIRVRSVESTVSMLGITDKHLRKHLVEKLRDQEAGTGFLADPVFEATFPWEKHGKRMESFSGNLLNESLVEGMNQAGDHRFGKDWFPFKHQVKAWQKLLDNTQKNSVVVTSGTGSGKTECFMVPILNDLSSEYKELSTPLVGIRALFIYPLNALINSQRERLRAWTQPFDDGVRFCLYNGNTEQSKHLDQSKNPNELLTRKNIRSTPPPIMVTNATMLEYMLVRQVDAPIIEQSKGKLRWIVLDEAHTYMGSQAAEISLLLRRVLHTFGVESKDVRFVATSATIGDKGADEKLQQYLANLAGVDIQNVHVVGGQREVQELTPSGKNDDDLNTLVAIDSGASFSTERYMRLCGNKNAIKLRESLTSKGRPATVSELAEDVYGDKSQIKQTELLSLLDIASFTVNPGVVENKPDIESEPFLPVRSHLFHQVISGLWCCVDKDCSCKNGSQLDDSWPFGYVYTQRRTQCECGSPIYELVFCGDCNEPHLMGVSTSDGRIIQYDRDSVDEFSLDYETPDDEEVEQEIAIIDRAFIAPRSVDSITSPVSINPEDWTVQGMGEGTIELNIVDSSSLCCSCCGYQRDPNPFRQSLLGTPFYISNTVPTLLEACQEGEPANELPSRGKRLITFTDSRQGTARISTKIQQDSERDSIRGQVYKLSASNSGSSHVSVEDENKVAKYEGKIEQFKNVDAEIAQEYIELRDGLLKAISNAQGLKLLSWEDLVVKLQTSDDISKWMYNYYSDINPELFNESLGSRTLSEMILLREFARRPKRKNSLETLGLISVCYPELESISKIPMEWEKLNFTLQDWKDFLKVALDFYVRENTILDIPQEWGRWMGARISPKTVMNPASQESTSNRIKKWPQVYGKRSNRLIRLIEAAAKMDITNKYNIDVVNNILKAAWKALTSETKILTPHGVTLNYNLNRQKIAFSVINSAWICPVTHRLIDTTFRGLTPYLPFNNENSTILCKKVDIPVCDIDMSDVLSIKERKTIIRKWVDDSEEVEALRSENLWTDISDRVVEGGAFYRAAEHSAQQPAKRLEKYERLFKEGKLNVLSCSTTMEMGVDIGGISVVAMNNVPPHPANYLQRAGRAGRRGETQAVAFTICKDNPHERGVFRNPLWPFTTSIPAPYIVLNSSQIVQRHVNSLLTAYFFKEIATVAEGKSVITLNCKWFFINENVETSPYEKMCLWLSELRIKPMPKALEVGVRNIVSGSILSSKSSAALSYEALRSLEAIGEKWLSKYQQLQNEIELINSVSAKDPFKKKMEYDLKRFSQDYLLSELASNTFLPGYGFPTGIATFDNFSMYRFKTDKYKKGADKGRVDNLTRMKERPGRDMSIAIREYAPGADVVLDGLVYKSAGILLNPISPDENFNQPLKMNCEWRCDKCGFIGQATSTLFNKTCIECGSELNPKDIKEYIEPLGFSVDFYSSPTTDISMQQYIPVEEPWVTANESLRSMFNPLLGSYRSSAEGHIFHHSSGENGSGYAICLRCGKAESMSIDGEFPIIFQSGKQHKKLKGNPGLEENAICEGSDDQRAVYPNLHLGGSNQTDVFELYLKNPSTGAYLSHRPNDPLSWTVAVVLRQALADIHGINANEIGYTVKPTSLPGFESVAGIALYDRCGGGAGFSSAAPNHIQDMLLNAKKHLDCPDDCSAACQSCLLGYDTRFHVNVLNRFVAKEYLESITNFICLPDEQKLFGEATQFCVATLDSEVLRYSDQGFSAISLYLHFPLDEWDLAASGVKARIIDWQNRFESISIVLPSGFKLDDGAKVLSDLNLFKSLGVQIQRAKDEVSTLVILESDDDSISFASTNLKIGMPNDQFWDLGEGCLVSGRIQVKPLSEEFIIDHGPELLIQQGDVEVEITNECDVLVSKFGSTLWDLLAAQSDKLNGLIDSGVEVKRISYSDPYVCSPWTLMLFSEVIDGLKQKLNYAWNSPLIYLTTSDKEPNSKMQGLLGEWQNQAIQRQVFEKLFEDMGEELELQFKPIKSMPHGRALVIEWESGETTTLRFDHGMGYWRIQNRSRSWFDIDASVNTQVNNLLSQIKVVSTEQGRAFPTQVFLKHRE